MPFLFARRIGKAAVVLALAALLLAMPAALAEAQDEPALTAEELHQWVEAFRARAMNAAPLNAPVGEKDRTEDGYAFTYDFGTLYADSATLTEDSALHAIVLSGESAACPHGVSLDDSVLQLLSAYANDNPTLLGDRDFAVLYAVDFLPDSAYWAWLARDGQRISLVQYAVHEQFSSGEEGYSDCGLTFTIEDNRVSAIRAYGLSSRVPVGDVLNNLAEVYAVRDATEYEQYAISAKGTDLEPFSREDLSFSDMDFLDMTPEDARSRFGAPADEVWFQDDTGEWLYTAAYSDLEMTFTFDANRANGRLTMFSVDGGQLEGPRGVRVGDSISSVMMRFRFGGGDMDDDGRDRLYGDGVTPPYGMAEYSDDMGATLRYAVSVSRAEDKRETVTFQLVFNGGLLSEFMLYIVE